MKTRREFLTYVGLGTYALLRQTPAVAAVFPTRRKHSRISQFTPIEPSTADKLILPTGFKQEILASYGDVLRGEETFGYDNDFTAYFPIDFQEGLLWVNHEDIQSVLMGHTGGTKSREQILKEKAAVGGSLLHLKKEKNAWKRVSSERTKRFSALGPDIPFSGPLAGSLTDAKGTLANCGGGVTPWKTVLTCEENYQNFNGPHKWSIYSDTKIDEQLFGWVVEIDPYGELPPQKLSALGRFQHENAAIIVGPSGRVVVYLGDDSQDQYLYKFVSHEKLPPKATRADKRKVLQEGTLYAADFEKGRWLPLDPEKSPALKQEGFESVRDVVLAPRKAAAALKATPLDRPEDCEIHPKDGTLYLALTNNAKHGNYFGQIVRLVENGENPEAESFRYEIYIAGGPQSGLACPDNLLFDKEGNLWVTCDFAAAQPPYAAFGNCGLFMVPTRGSGIGNAYQFASAPTESELTGPSFTPDGKTLFLSVQHPGERTIDVEHPTSRWPQGGASLPKPSVVAISGF